MAIRVGINGFGRIGRNFFRAQQQLGADIEIVALNDLGDAKTMAHLLKYDSVLGPFAGDVELGDGVITRRRREDEDALRARPGGAAVGRPRRRRRARVDRASSPTATARRSTSTRARRRSSSPRPRPTPTSRVVLGVNDGDYDPDAHHIVSNASCTTNCVAPLAKVLDDLAGDRVGLHDDDPRVHERPEHPRPAAQGPPPRPRRGDQPDPDLDRRREGDRARAAAPAGQGRRHLGARAGADRLDHRPRRHARPRGHEGRGRTRAYAAAAADGPLAPDPPVLATTRSSRPTSSAIPYSCIFDSQLTMAHGRTRQGLRLVRQRVGLLLPARRPHRATAAVSRALRRRRRRLPNERCRARSRRRTSRASASSSAPTSTSRSRTARSPTTRGSARRSRRSSSCSTAARPTSPSARTSAGRRATTRRSRSRPSRPGCASSCPTSASACSRTRASTRARRRTTRLRARARGGHGPLRQRRLRLGAPRARLDGGASRTSCRPTRGCCSSRSSSTSARLLGEVERPFVLVAGGAKVEDKLGVLENLGGRADTRDRRRQDGRGAPRRQPARRSPSSCPSDVVAAASFDADAESRSRARTTSSPDGWLGLDIGPETRERVRRADPRRADGLLERPDGRLRVGAVRRGHEGGRGGGRRRATATPSSAAATRCARSPSSGSTTTSRGSRPAAAPRSSCSRARSCRASRRSRRRSAQATA